ncbi:MAG TPA: hypothetical protein VFT94_01790, partial [Gaiellaceae bacterium]|nr:hypothetical protein [Gaiellaceae bacterium]
MTEGALRAAGVAVLLALASASAGASASRPPVALTASPAHVELAGSGRTTVRVTNSGASRAVLDVRRAGFALDLRGEPRIVGQAGPRSAAAWLGFRPRTLTIGPGASASVTIVSKVPERAEPGDHDALLLFTTRRRVRDGLAVRVRMGVVVVVRTPGTVVRRLALRGLRTTKTKRGRMLELLIVNRGNVTEAFARGRTVISLERASRRLARLIAEPRSLRPGTRGALRFPMRRRLVGPVLARVDLLTEAGRIQRVYRLRL